MDKQGLTTLNPVITGKLPVSKQGKKSFSYINRQLQDNHKRKRKGKEVACNQDKKLQNGEYKDLQIGNENVYHILEPKAEDDKDKAALYEVPVFTKTKKLRLSNEKACWEQTPKSSFS